MQGCELIRTRGHQGIATLGSEARQVCCSCVHAAWAVRLQCAHALGSRLAPAPSGAGCTAALLLRACSGPSSHFRWPRRWDLTAGRSSKR